jgi:hypothetical protein
VVRPQEAIDDRTQEPDETPVVVSVAEDHHACHAATYDVEDSVAEKGSRLAWHRGERMGVGNASVAAFTFRHTLSPLVVAAAPTRHAGALVQGLSLDVAARGSSVSG